MKWRPGTNRKPLLSALLLWAAVLLAACAGRGADPVPLPAERPVYEGLDGPKPIVVYVSITPGMMELLCERQANPLCRRKAYYPHYIGYLIIDESYRISWHQKAPYPLYREAGAWQADPEMARRRLVTLSGQHSLVTYGRPPDDSFVPEFSMYYLCKPGESYPLTYPPFYPVLPPGFSHLRELERYVELGKPPSWDRRFIPQHMR